MRKRKLYLSEFLSRYNDKLENRTIQIVHNSTVLATYNNWDDCINDLKDTSYWDREVIAWDIAIAVQILV